MENALAVYEFVPPICLSALQKLDVKDVCIETLYHLPALEQTVSHCESHSVSAAFWKIAVEWDIDQSRATLGSDLTFKNRTCD